MHKLRHRSEGYVESNISHHFVGDFVVLFGVGFDVSLGVGAAIGVEIDSSFEERALEVAQIAEDGFEGAVYVGDVADPLVLQDVSLWVVGIGVEFESYLVCILRRHCCTSEALMLCPLSEGYFLACSLRRASTSS